MSDAQVTITRRAVIRDGVDKLYYIYQWLPGHGWVRVPELRGYPHSTSAYAQLGRLTNRDSQHPKSFKNNG